MDGIERIKVLASEVEDKQVKKIINYLLSRTDMNEKYLNEEKSLKQMLSFIGNEVKKKFKSTRIDNGMEMICTEDEDIYSLAIHYWDESNESLRLTKNEIKEEKVDIASEDDSKEVVKVEKVEPTKSNKKEWVAEGQLSLF